MRQETHLVERCSAELGEIHTAMMDAERRHAPALVQRAPSRAASLTNFLHYLALRGRDLRALQENLARLGLSSLGRAESHVLYTVEAVLHALDALARRDTTRGERGAPSFADGLALLEENTRVLLGPRPDGRSVRIMVTLPSDAALDTVLVRSLIERGMNVVRINCAHDDADTWTRMVENVRWAREQVGQPCRVQMDLGGPKLRTGECAPDIVVGADDVVVLTRSAEPGRPAIVGANGTVDPARIPCSLPEVLDDVRAGDRVFFDDGKIRGVVDAVDARQARIRILHARATGSKLCADRGINLPDSELRLPALTRKDRADLVHAVKLADMVALSFVQRPEDVADVDGELARLGADRVGLVLKIETRRGFTELPSILLGTVSERPLGVMIARGDMAVECGYQRMAEIQEEMLWLCEAAHVPVIWATQVLDRLARKGLPTRAEITDAAMSERAECVMLNKGPYILEAIELLDGILKRMETHQHKKSPTLRRLSVSRLPL